MSLVLGLTTRAVARRVMLSMGLGAALAAAAALVVSVPAASAAAAESYGVEKFLAGTCNVPNCEVKSEPSAFFTQAAGHPPYGITEFKFLGKAGLLGEAPIGNVRTVRVDLPAGLSVSPEALPKCEIEAFKENKCPANTHVGEDQATVLVELGGVGLTDVTLKAEAFNLEPEQGLAAEYGISLDLAGVLEEHIYLEGGLSWHPETGISGQPVLKSGDYHEYFIIKNISKEHPLLASRLIFEGNDPGQKGGFITLPSSCDGPQTTYLETESYNGEFSNASFTTHYEKGSEEVPLEATGCNEIPFEPKVTVTPANAEPDRADGATVVVSVPQDEDPTKINSSTVKDATVTLPEGMTLNPAAASGLAACTDKEFAKGTAEKVSCPAASQIGTTTIETPMLPRGALQGEVYIGAPIPSKPPSSGEEYRVFISAESERYNLAVRLEGRVKANEATGQLTTLVTEAPPLPFSEFILKLEAGEHTPLANPLTCGVTTGAFVPYSAPTTSVTASSPFDVSSGGHACPAAPFEVAQSAASTPSTGGAYTSFAFNLTRPEGRQYISQLSTTLPEGLVGEIPAVPLCGEPQAAEGSCPPASRIGTASVTIGSGAKPYGLSGSVYLTGPYDGAPYGMSIAVPAEKVGPYDYGTIVTRAKIEIDPYSARVTVASSLPTVVGGAPIRLRSLSVTVNHEGFLINPTNCGALATETSLTSTFGASVGVSTPFQASGCESLPFKPKLTASTKAKHTRKGGASLAVTMTEPAHGANVHSVAVMLPRKIVARLETLNLACTEAEFAAGPSSCPPASKVGKASVTTPVLPGKLTGHAYYVSRGKAGFPNLDVVLEGDGVRVILIGDTRIKGSYTHSRFASVPDIPFSRFTLKLPMGRHSALSANGNLCKHKLKMPTTIVAQNGKKVTDKTRIKVSGCKKARKRHGGKRHGGRHHRGKHQRGKHHGGKHHGGKHHGGKHHGGKHRGGKQARQA